MANTVQIKTNQNEYLKVDASDCELYKNGDSGCCQVKLLTTGKIINITTKEHDTIKALKTANKHLLEVKQERGLL